MGASAGPDIIEDGLVLALDAADRNSYPGSGTTWTDLSGRGNNGSLVNGVAYNSTNGGTLVFDNVDEYVQIVSDGKGTAFEVPSYTIEAVCYRTTTGDSVIWSYDYTSHDPPYYAQHLRMSNDTLFFGWNHAGVLKSISNTFSLLNEWIVVTATHTSGYQAIYGNGVLLNSSTLVGDITYYNQEIWIGKGNYGSSQLGGNIANVRFYNRALTASEIQQNFNMIRGRFGI